MVRKQEQPEEKKEHILTGEHEHATFILYRSARDVYFFYSKSNISFRVDKHACFMTRSQSTTRSETQ